VTIIYISHRLEEIFAIADVVTVLKDGRVVGARAIDQITRPELIQMMVGRPLEEVFPPRVGRAGEARLVVENVSAGPVRNANFTLYAGEILGIAGMVGSGRTELARAIFGADPVQSGQIHLSGAALTGHTPRQAISAGLALAPEDRKRQGLFLGQSIRHNLTLPILTQLTQWGIIQREQESQRVATAQREMAIQMTSPGQLVQYLSGGNQQKVVLAKWRIAGVKVLILDHPTRGIDVGAKEDVYDLIREMTAEGLAIILLGDTLEEVIGLSSRILVMRDGKVTARLEAPPGGKPQQVELLRHMV
jgi:ribose transport system ATP-binding protein